MSKWEIFRGVILLLNFIMTMGFALIPDMNNSKIVYEATWTFRILMFSIGLCSLFGFNAKLSIS